MKKYLIVNDDGTKKTIYAKDLIQALKLGDAVNITPGMFISLKVGPQRCVYRVKEINHGEYGVVLVCYSINEDGQLVERDAGGNYSFASLKKNVTNIFNTYDEAKKYLLHHDAVRTAYITGLKSLRKKNDSVDAAANLPTTLQALINDEEAAIKAYEVAIKNLEDKIDENQMQVLINIMKDERKHVENLYAILNNQVTEKNLEDSIHDSRIRDAYEVLWYTDEKLNNYETREFRSRSAAMDFYNAHKNDKDKFAWWVTRRNSDWAVVEDIVY